MSQRPMVFSLALTDSGAVSGFRICAKVGMMMPRSLQRLAVRFTTSGL